MHLTPPLWSILCDLQAYAHQAKHFRRSNRAARQVLSAENAAAWKHRAAWYCARMLATRKRLASAFSALINSTF